jgi:hypothetical protein
MMLTDPEHRRCHDPQIRDKSCQSLMPDLAPFTSYFGNGENPAAGAASTTRSSTPALNR